MDSDHADDLDKCMSLVGHVFTLASDAVSWDMSLQDHVALSLTKAEYMTLTFIMKKTIWLRGLLSEFGLE